MRGRIVKHMVHPLILASGLILSAGCSSSQQEDENLEATEDNEAANDNATNNENNNLGQDDAAEGNGQENFVDNNDSQANAGAQGADANSATTELDPTLDNSGSAPVNNTAAVPMNTAPMNNAMAAPAGGEGAPVPGGRVRYVREGGIQAVNAPGGQPVMMIEQGEHPVTWEENGYLRIANGVYVPVDAMSDKGVARPVTSGGWAH
jgi:hypothetical protein